MIFEIYITFKLLHRISSQRPEFSSLVTLLERTYCWQETRLSSLILGAAEDFTVNLLWQNISQLAGTEHPSVWWQTDTMVTRWIFGELVVSSLRYYPCFLSFQVTTSLTKSTRSIRFSEHLPKSSWTTSKRMQLIWNLTSSRSNSLASQTSYQMYRKKPKR